MYGTNPDLYLSLLRHILTFAGGMAVARGWISADMSAQVMGAVVTLAGVGFSLFFHASSNGTIPTVSTTPSVQGNIETRTVIRPAVPATETSEAKPVTATTTVNAVKTG